MHHVCVESYAVGYMDECSMTVVIQIDSSWAPSALSITRMISLTLILLAHFITNIAFALSLNIHLEIETELFGCFTVRFGYEILHITLDLYKSTDERSRLTIWSLKSRKSRLVAKLVFNLLFPLIRGQKLQFAYLFFRRRRSHPHLLIGIR